MSKRYVIPAYLLFAAVMIAGALALVYNLSPLFDKVQAQIASGQTVVMDKDLNANTLDSLLRNGDYVSDPKDAALISRWYKDKLSASSGVEFLDKINSEQFRIPADSIKNYGGEGLKARLAADMLALGQDEEWGKIDKAALQSSFGTPTDSTACITVNVSEQINEGGFSSAASPVQDVIVRVCEHTVNKDVPSSELAFSDESRVLGYAVTDASGAAKFNLPKGKYYSVLPIREGFKYGEAKGTTSGALTKDLEPLHFAQKQHKIRPLSPGVYKQMRKDQAIVARTPQNFISTLYTGIGVFLGIWALTLASIWIMDRRLGRRTDMLIPLSLMILTGMGLLALYGTMRPLSDTFFAQKMVWYTVVGCVLMVALSGLNYLRLFQKYQSIWAGKMSIGQSTYMNVAYCYPFIILAVLLMVLLRFFGSGPSGSDARVNLGFFQPSEVVKYLVVIFLALFFVVKGDVIRTFGARMTKDVRSRYLGIIGVVLLGIAFISLLFLGMLKDMGPGLVILTTFILMYSIVRRDFPQLLLGILSYMVVVGVAYMLTPSVSLRLSAIGIWFALWIAFGWFKSKTVYESAIFFNLLISLFLAGGYLIRPFLPNMADRLFNRTNMAWSGIFDNAIPHGDQIAQGLWGTASGGFTGMGIGGGSSFLIPAGHTDLILSSIGEQMGWLGLLIIAVCFFILVTHTTSAAQYSGHKFTMYLCLGLGLLTGVQFLFIALGGVGAIPLTGVPVPFLSYSGTSIILALASYGIVISISRHRGTQAALKAFVVSPTPARHSAKEKPDMAALEAKSLYRNLFAEMVLFFIGIVVMLSITGYYQLISREKTMLRPAVTSSDKGLRVLAYNPRIERVIDMLNRGNLYDRNGLLLASSSKKDLHEMQEKLLRAGVDPDALDALLGKQLKRYYPFGSDMVFMVGDINRPDVYSNFGPAPMGYLAENANEDMLRGFKTNPKVIELTSDSYKYNRFLDPAQNVSLKYALHDYSVLLPALNQPIYRNKFIEDFNASRQQRDVQLAMDAHLQTTLQHNLADYIASEEKLASLPNLRASVVVLDASNGELLTSANYPLPSTDSILNLRELHLDTKGGAPSEWRVGAPVTERDLGLTYQTAPGSTAKVMTAIAGFKKLGTSAFDKGFDIFPSMCVEPPTSEPNHLTATMNRGGGRITYLDDAIKYSSNSYFVMLLDEEDLYNELGDVYWAVGASLSNRKPYFFSTAERTQEGKSRFEKVISTFRTNGLKDYKKYMEHTNHSDSWDKKSHDRMQSIQAFTGIAWGQSQLDASPLNMARVAAIAANGGKLMPTQFLLGHSDGDVIDVVDTSSAALLAKAMNMETGKWVDKQVIPEEFRNIMGGKTGTPMRYMRGNTIMNDGWYICYVKSPNTGRSLAIALRLERLPNKMISTEAVHAVAKVVLPTLQQCGYLN